jgi:hypothetical protein
MLTYNDEGELERMEKQVQPFVAAVVEQKILYECSTYAGVC